LNWQTVCGLGFNAYGSFGGGAFKVKNKEYMKSFNYAFMARDASEAFFK
jgi:hypothetical protein